VFTDAPYARRPPARLVAIVLLGLACTPDRAHAQGAEQVAVVLEPCDEASAAGAEELFRALQTELSPAALYGLEPGSDAREHARLEVSWCHGLSHLSLRTPEGDAQARSLSLSDTPPEVRARTIALSVGELWRTVQPEQRLLSLAAAPARAETAPEPTSKHDGAMREDARDALPPPSEGRSRPRIPLAISAHGGMRALPASDTMLFGGALTLDVWRLRTGAVVLAARGERDPVTLSIGIAAAKLGLELVRLGKRPYLVLRAVGELGVTWADFRGLVSNSYGIVFAPPKYLLLAGGHLEVALVAAMAERWRGELAATFGYQRGRTARTGLDDDDVTLSTQGAAIGLSLGFTLLTRSQR
jgi:hypothetical protein